MAEAHKGDLVQIHLIVLEPGARPNRLPESTLKAPYEAWIKGFLADESAEIGQKVRIITYAERELRGILTAISPAYDHNFGSPRPELLPIGHELAARLGQGEH